MGAIVECQKAPPEAAGANLTDMIIFFAKENKEWSVRGLKMKLENIMVDSSIELCYGLTTLRLENRF
jgi:hypothetical protein